MAKGRRRDIDKMNGLTDASPANEQQFKQYKECVIQEMAAVK